MISDVCGMMGRILKIAVYLIVVFVIQELVFRVAFPLPELSNFDRRAFVLETDVAGSGMVRNRSYYWQSLPDTNHRFYVRYNGYGFRDSEWKVKKATGKRRCMFVGDSFVEGIMAEQDQTIPEYFKKASSEKNLEIMNAGMLGTGMKQYLQFVADAVPIFRPDVVFLVVYANDFTSERVAIPEFNLEEEYYSGLTPRLIELLTQLKRDEPIPFVMSSADNKMLPDTESPNFPWENRIEEMYLHADSNLVEYMLKAELNPYRLNQSIRDERMFREPCNFLVPMDFFRYYSEKFDFEPVVVFIPSRNQITDKYGEYDFRLGKKLKPILSLTAEEYQKNQKHLKQVCNRLGLKFIDLTSEIKRHELNGNHLYWNYDDHMRAKGYKIVGETLFNLWSDEDGNVAE